MKKDKMNAKAAPLVKQNAAEELEQEAQKAEENLHAGHRNRQRKLFLKTGFGPATPSHQMLEMLLYFAIPRKDTNLIAHRLIKRFQTIAGVLDAPEQELRSVEGVGDSVVCLLKMLLPILRRYNEEKANVSTRVMTHSTCIELLSKKYFGQSTEMVYMLFLNNTGRLIRCELLGEGNMASVRLSLRTVVELVVWYEATAVVLSHNHPMGFAVPSDSDCVMTRRLCEMLRKIDVKLLDHIIFAGDDCVSMAISNQYKHLFE